MPRYKLTVEYDGRPYRGFQAQEGLASVQGAIERAVKAFCGQDLRLQAAGRTDTGVHATGQVVHIDLDKAWKPDVVRDALNAHLIEDSVVILAAEVPDDPSWHARFSATERRYIYRIPRPAMPGEVAGDDPGRRRRAAAGRRGGAGVRLPLLPASPGPVDDRDPGRGGCWPLGARAGPRGAGGA